MKRLLSALLLPTFCLTLAACTGEKDNERDNTAMLPENQRVSNVPWNKPEGWENTSQLGALAQDPRFNGSANH